MHWDSFLWEEVTMCSEIQSSGKINIREFLFLRIWKKLLYKKVKALNQSSSLSQYETFSNFSGYYLVQFVNNYNFFIWIKIFQLLLSVPSSTSSTTLCPSIRAFKFPSGCVCHGETSDDKESDIHAVISIA